MVARWVSVRVLLFGASLAALGVSRDVGACGCFAPPIPTPAEQSFAVNQRAEQVIFEVSEGKVAAHVRILYQGDPAEFAWLLPVPTVPDLELSHTELFGLIDTQTKPVVGANAYNLCPSQRYQCQTHPPCPYYGPVVPAAAIDPYGNYAGAPLSGSNDPLVDQATSAPLAPPVTVLASARVGSYDTVTFAAEEADLAIQWLNENGFIVNETMSPYMQPYLDAEMVFVASKLVPGSELEEIRPLKLTYEAEFPAIPLRLTAIAAEPHMMVTAFIYAEQEFQPIVAPMVTFPVDDLAVNNRSNYPMVFARAVDEMGGFAFVKEYVGPGPTFSDPTGCCTSPVSAQKQELPPVLGSGDAGPLMSLPGDAGPEEDASPPGDAGSGGAASSANPATDASAAPTPTTPLPSQPGDACGLTGNGLCECPEAPFDASDCSADLIETFAAARELATKYPVLTRLSTRISPEEMIEDPIFEPAQGGGNYRATFIGETVTLEGCTDRAVDPKQFTEIERRKACTSVYCDFGECVFTEQGAGCACDEGFAARVFTDVDNQLSVTCVPDRPTVDFAAGGLELESSCTYDPAGDEECLDLGGFPAVHCPEDEGAVIGSPAASGPTIASCSPIIQRTSTPGAQDYASEFAELEICEPPPPSCPADGWLMEMQPTIEGVECDPPDPSWLQETPPRVCPPPPANPSASGAVGAAGIPPLDGTLMDTMAPRPGSEGGASHDSGWCSMTGSMTERRASRAGVLLGLLGLFGLLRRRRAQPA